MAGNTPPPLPPPPDGPAPFDEVACAPRAPTPHHYTLLERVVQAVARWLDWPDGPPKPLPPPPASAPPPEPAPPPAASIRRHVRLGGPGWVWPMERHPTDHRPPVISDGYHTAADLAVGRAIRTHRGVDVMYRRPQPWPAKGDVEHIDHPWQSRGHEVPPNIRARAAGPGTVTVSKKLATGWAVCIDHGNGVETAYHHLERSLVVVGQDVVAGEFVGIVGGSPPARARVAELMRKGVPRAAAERMAHGLIHLHFDLVVNGRFVDPEPYLRSWPAP